MGGDFTGQRRDENFYYSQATFSASTNGHAVSRGGAMVSGVLRHISRNYTQYQAPQ